VLSGTPAEANMGPHTVIITISDGVFLENHTFTINVVPQWGVGVDLTSALVSKIYPNPARHTVTFEFTGEVSSIEISDLSGKVLIREMVDEGDNSVQLDVSVLNKGIYMFRAFDKDQSQTGKIIIN
jgi:hypothetical protein